MAIVANIGLVNRATFGIDWNNLLIFQFSDFEKKVMVFHSGESKVFYSGDVSWKRRLDGYESNGTGDR